MRGLLSAEGSPTALPSREDLIEQGLSPQAASRLAVRQSLQIALEVAFARCGVLWICSCVVLVLGMVGVIIWSEMIYDQHNGDNCDQPLAQLLQALYIIVAIHTFQREIIRHALCYNLSTNGPVEPLRVVLFRRGTLAACLLWPVAGASMLHQTRSCSPELIAAVQVIVVYYALAAIVIVVLPMCFLSVMLVLVRRGLLRAPRSRDAAPEELCDDLEKLRFDPARFDDDKVGCYPAGCSICLANFDDSQPISKTPCPTGLHAFHTECLRGWLQCARTCPLCRHDLTIRGEQRSPADAECGNAGIELQSPRAAS